MRITIIILFIALFQAKALESYSQTTKVSVEARQMALTDLFPIIEKQSEFLFFYVDSDVKGIYVNVNAKDKQIGEILSNALSGTNLTYTINDRSISITKQNDVNQQTRLISGKVTDPNGEPVIGVNIMVQGTSNGTITDLNGAFKLEVPSGAILQVSYIGYLQQIIPVGNQQNFSIVLKEDTQNLDEVVVVGYGIQKKSVVTAAISRVTSKDLSNATPTRVEDVLKGKISGVQITQNSGQPGTSSVVRIRGIGTINNSDPLYIVDGMPVSSGIDYLNPKDIESIEVLKDASATSIYGARAANGVVIITTKRGKEGKTKVSYSYNYSYQKYSDTYDLLSLPEWMEEKNKTSWELWVWNNKVAPWGTKTLEEALMSPVNGIRYNRPYTEQEIANAGAGTDWLDLVTRNGLIQEHNINLQGGNKGTQYMLSFNYFNHEGIIRNSGMTRYTMKANIDQEFLNIFKAGLNLTMTRIINDNTQLGSDKWENSGLIRSAVEMGPQIQAYDPETGKYPTNPLVGTRPNPYSLLNNVDRGNTDRVLGNIFVEARPLDGLTLRVNAGIDRAAQSRKTYQPKSTLNGYNLQGVASVYSMDNNQYLLEATATYLKTFAKIHKINLLAGTSYEQFNYEGVNAGNNNFLTDGFIYNNLGAGGGNKIVGSGSSENKMLSYFFRANYILKDRYLLTATLRSDGASVFARNHKWGYFPSVALGWTISEENFMAKASDWLSMLKLRLSWGQTGNADISTNAFASYYAQEAYNKEDKSKQIGVFQGRLENPDLKWETTTEWNAGLDFGFFNGCISGSVEYYYKVISDLLNYKPLNSYQTITQVIANIGKTKSTGIEVTLNTKNIVTKDFFWSTDLTFTKYKDRWKERTPDWKPAVYEKYDAPIRAIYSRRADHILQIGEKVPDAQPLLLPGQLVIKDINGYVRDANGDPVVDENGRFQLLGHPDNIIDDADMELIGTSDPGWLAGMTNTFKYKDFDLSFHLNGMFDRIMEDPTAMEYGISGDGIARYGLNALRSVKDRWTWDNPSTTNPSTFQGWENTYSSGDFYYQKAWFIRMQNITLGYTLPKHLLAKTKVISNLRIHASINNAFIITPYDGLDPETDYYAASYPNARTFSFGVDISF